MTLFEADEAANRIREEVDSDANIIFGSTFDEKLNGKIRVSVVATGIEQVEGHAEEAQRPFSLGGARGPARPASAGSHAPVAQPSAGGRPFGKPAEPAAAPEPELAVDEAAPAHAPEPVAYEPAPAPFAPPPFQPAPFAPPHAEAEEPLELNVADEAMDMGHLPPLGEPAPVAHHELRLDASHLADEEPSAPPAPGRRRALVPDQAPAAPMAHAPEAAASGGTLFERMANLTGRRKAAEEDEDDDGGAVNIPRFLGRQNNQ